VLDMYDGVVKLADRTFYALCLELGGIVAAIHHYFEGADFGHRLGSL
jgi:hypothetical protein